jgi:hypothetical protein
MQGGAVGHDPENCTICTRSDRMEFDAIRGFHFVPHDSEAAFPLFKLYPIIPEPA